MKKLFISFIVSVGLIAAMFAQTDQRTRETKIADIVMQLPASNTASFNQLMGELSRIDGVIADLAPRLADPGGNDAQIRSAISGLAMYASKEASLKQPVAKAICNAIPKAKSDEIRDFLFIQLQYVAGDESVETVLQYLDNARLADAAARVLVCIGNDAAGKAILNKVKGAQQITLVEALGDMRYQPANDAISALAATGDAKLRKAALHSLAMIADPSSEKTLAEAAAKVGYRYEPTDAFGSYVLFLRNVLLLPGSDPSTFPMVAESAKKMLKATSETSQIAAKSAALELYVMAMRGNNEKKAVDEILTALKSDSRQYRQAALDYSLWLQQTPKMYEELIKQLKKSDGARKAELIRALGTRGIAEIAHAGVATTQNPLSAIAGCLQDKNADVRIAAIETAGKLANVLPENMFRLPELIAAVNTNDGNVVAAGRNTLLTLKNSTLANEVAAAIPQATSAAKVAFLEILASRRAEQQAGTIFAQTSSSDASVRMAACKALASVAAEKDVPRIAQLLNAASNKDEIAALQQALFVAVSGQSQDKQTDTVVEQASKSSNPAAYGNVLAMIGGKKALDMVMDQGFNSGNAGLKEAAFEALTNWSDGLATPQLYKIAAGNTAGAYFDKALAAYIAKTGAAKSAPEQKLVMLRAALDIAKTPAQKQTILRQIARTGTFTGLITAGKYLGDSNNDVQQAAVQAVRTIALAHPEYYGPEVTALLNRAMAVNKDAEADYQKQAIQKHLASLPNDGGFVSMFNGKDLSGWKGLVENPIARAKMTPKQLAEKQAKADEIMRRDWKVVDGLLVFEGKGYDNLCSAKDYGDFEMYVDWRITKGGDAGVYLRGSPQVQIWDLARTDVGAQVGSGGLYNNQKHMSKPLVVADNPVNEWNSFYIKMIGEKVTVYLNGQLVTDNITLENYWDRKLPIFEKDAIELQAHGERVEYRDIYVREIPRPEPYRVSDAEKAEGFVPMFNGIDMSGWVGNLKDYIPRDGAIVCEPAQGGHGNLYTDKEYSDFIMRFEFQLTPAANNGLGIRTPLDGDAAYVGMELQILDGEAEVYKDIQPYQHHGSVYGVIAAKRGYMKPVGEWNYQEVIAEGNHIKITLNGTVILDGDIAQASKNFTETVDHRQHPGLSNKSGHIGFLGHGSELAFRNLRIKDLTPVVVIPAKKGKK